MQMPVKSFGAKKFGPNYPTPWDQLSQIEAWILVELEIVNFGRTCEIWSTLWNLVEILTIFLKIVVKIVKSSQNCEI